MLNTATLAHGGARILGALHEGAFIVRFAYAAMAAALTPSIYRVATRDVTRRQVYFTAWTVLPWFTLLSALLMLVLMEIAVTVARSLGLSPLALELILRALPLEVIPFLTALYVALRSGSAISTEIALKHVRGDLERLEAAGGDAMRDEFIPRIVACAFSVIALMAVSSAVAFALAYAVLYGFSPSGFEEFTHVVGRVYSLPVVAGLVLKSAVFGIAVAVVPIASGLSIPRDMGQVPVAVRKGMVRLFFTIALVQAASLAAKYV